MAAALVAAGAPIYAQGPPPPGYGPNGRYAPDSVSALVMRVHTDLNQAYGGFHFGRGDRDRLNHAEKQLRDFARKWRRGRFDKGELDDAIAAIQHVLDNNHMGPGVRDAIDRDVNELRGMREAYDRHELHP